MEDVCRLEIFLQAHGYDQAATRDIALEAGVNPPALQDYFDGKAGLHRACAQFIIDRASITLGPALEQAQLAIKDGRAGGVADAVVGLMEEAHLLALATGRNLTGIKLR